MVTDYSNQENQRDFHRCGVEISFSFSIIKGKEIIGPYPAHTINLSGGGMFFATTCPMLQAGDLILAEFSEAVDAGKCSDGSLSGDFMARVIRNAANEAGNLTKPDCERSYQLAVEFQFLHKATKNDIVAFLNQYEAFLRHQQK
jgi:hypothetical protein